MDDDKIDILGKIRAVLRHKGLIAGITGLAALFSIIISLLLPNTYSAKAIIYPLPQDQGMASTMVSQLGSLTGLAGGALGRGTTTDLFVVMLKSTNVKSAIVDRFKLMDLYRIKYRVDAYRFLDGIVNVEAEKKGGGVISITVNNKDPKRAADMANAFVEEVGKLSVSLNVAGASMNRSFLEERLAKVKSDLSQAEEAMRKFSSKHKAIQVTEQAKATIARVAALSGQLAAQQVHLALLQGSMTDSNQEVITARNAIASLRSQIARIEGAGEGGAIPSVGAMPALGQEYVRLMREFKVQETLFETLTKQYEMMKLSESKNFPSIQVIQNAEAPDKKSKPKRAKIVIMSVLAAFVGSIALALGIENWRALSEDEKSQWKDLASHIPILRLK